MGLDLVFLDRIHRPLHPHSPHPPPLPPHHRPPPPRPSRPNPGPPLPNHVGLVRHHLFGDPTVHLVRNQREPMVLATEQDDPSRLAPLLPVGDQTDRPGFLLVVFILPIQIPSHAKDLLFDFETEHPCYESIVQ